MLQALSIQERSGEFSGKEGMGHVSSPLKKNLRAPHPDFVGTRAKGRASWANR